MATMRGAKAVEALHEPGRSRREEALISVRDKSEPPHAGSYQKKRRFMVPVHAQERREAFHERAPEGQPSWLPVRATFQSPVATPDEKVRPTDRLESLPCIPEVVHPGSDLLKAPKDHPTRICWAAPELWAERRLPSRRGKLNSSGPRPDSATP